MDDTSSSPPGLRIRKIRLARNLSRTGLALAARVSPATVRRIENGSCIKWQDALALARALDVSPHELFGPVIERLQQFDDDERLLAAASNDVDFRLDLGRMGVDISPRNWLLQLRFRGGTERIIPVAAPDIDRFHRVLDECDDNKPAKFFVVDSFAYSAAINLKEVAFSQALACLPKNVEKLHHKAGPPIEVLVSGGRETLRFESLPDEQVDEAGRYQGQLHALLEALDKEGHALPLVTFDNVSGRKVWLPTDTIAMIRITHGLLFGAEEEASHEDEEADSDVVETPLPPWARGDN